jgi:superfamily II DNA or RNA helicase
VIDVILHHRVVVPDSVEPALMDELKDEFAHNNPAYHAAKRRRQATDEPIVLRTWRQEKDAVSFPRGGLARVEKILKRGHVRYRVLDQRILGKRLGEEYEHSVTGDPGAPGELWEPQKRMLAVIAEKETALLRAATASGKTTTILAAFVKLGVPLLVIVHNRGLLKQWVRRIVKELGIAESRIGRIGGGKFRLAPVTIAMHQTLAKGISRETLDYFGFVAVDEVHRAAARTMFAACDPFPAHWRVGVSDLEKRRDRKQFLVYDLFGPVAVEVTREEMQRAGHVLDVEIRVLPTEFKAPWYERVMMNLDDLPPGSANRADRRLLDEMSTDVDRNALAVAAVRAEVAAGEQCIVLSRRVEHCQYLDRLLVAQDIRTGYLVGENEQEFDGTIQRLADRTCSVGVGTIEALGTGIDLPYVGVGVTAHPVAGNEGLVRQLTGRLARAPAGKTRAVMYVLWDRHVHGKGHLRNLVKWNSRVRVLTDAGWVAGDAALDRANLSLSLSGITEKLSGTPIHEGSLRRNRMRQRKPSTTTPTNGTGPAAMTAENALRVQHDSDAAHLLADDKSGLAIALKSKGRKVPPSVITGWSMDQRVSAAMWAQGKLDAEDVPDHIALYDEDGLIATALRTASLPGTSSDLAELATKLGYKGVGVKLVEIERWTAEQRAEARNWAEGEGPKPDFLAGSESATPRKPRKPAGQAPADAQTTVGVSIPRFVDVTWGAEVFNIVPGSYSPCTIGPFSQRGPILEGETYADAFARLYAEVVECAVKERKRKVAVFRETLEENGVTHGGKLAGKAS